MALYEPPKHFGAGILPLNPRQGGLDGATMEIDIVKKKI